MEVLLQRAGELKQTLTDFVLDAEGDLAVALETYIAEHSDRQVNSQNYDIAYNDRLVDTFITEGEVNGTAPLDLFLAHHADLSDGDRELVSNWKLSFIGLFEVLKVEPDGCELMNWLSAKHYQIKAHNSEILAAIAKLKVGEILLVRLAPIQENLWMFSSPWTQLGTLGKPKLAVAIGSFKQNYKRSLYSDAPELLEMSWQSVEKYHRDFVDFFDSDEVTLSGYELGKKLNEFQEQLSQKQLEAAGIDSSKSLAEVAENSGVEKEELLETAETFGIDRNTADRLFSNKNAAKMVVPKIELPENLKKAEQVTVLAHPRWGQLFLTSYQQLQTLLDTDGWENNSEVRKIATTYLEDPQLNAYVWLRLAKNYPQQIEKLLQILLERPQLQFEHDFGEVLAKYNKSIEPELPEIASVPLHLHNLFQDALAEVNKSKSKAGKGKVKTKTGKGFQ